MKTLVLEPVGRHRRRALLSRNDSQQRRRRNSIAPPPRLPRPSVGTRSRPATTRPRSSRASSRRTTTPLVSKKKAASRGAGAPWTRSSGACYSASAELSRPLDRGHSLKYSPRALHARRSAVVLPSPCCAFAWRPARLFAAEAADATEMTARVVVIRAEDPLHVAMRGLRECERLRCSDLELPILVAGSGGR